MNNTVLVLRIAWNVSITPQRGLYHREVIHQTLLKQGGSRLCARWVGSTTHTTCIDWVPPTLSPTHSARNASPSPVKHPSVLTARATRARGTTGSSPPPHRAHTQLPAPLVNTIAMRPSGPRRQPQGARLVYTTLRESPWRVVLINTVGGWPEGTRGRSRLRGCI